MTDAELQELYAEVIAHRAERMECTPPEKLLDLVERRGPEEERLELLDHVMACADCMREFELLRSIAEARPRTRRSSVRPLAIAAGFVLVIGSGIIWQQTRDDVRAPDVMRGPGEELLLVAPSDQLAAGEPATFIWRATEGAVEYELELLDSEGTALYTASTRDTTLTLPETIVLDPGASYAWWVRARRADGSERASAIGRFRVEHR